MTQPVTVMDSCIVGRYRLTSRIASGGMGEVWRGRDERLKRDIAVKLLRPEHAESAEFRARLRIEAQSAASVSSDRVVSVYDWGEQRDEHGRWLSFIVMELIDGETVSALLAREGTLAPGCVAALIDDAATALAQAHRRGVIHRDIKPANLLVGPDGRLKVADFGIARAKDATRLTATGTLLGTATYLSPEQVQGRPLTPASDIFSLGVVAYQCLAGRPPFVAEGDIATALARLQFSAPPLPVTVPTALADLVTGMLARAPELRPTADDILRGGPTVETGAKPTLVIRNAVVGDPTRVLPTARPGFRRRSIVLATVAILLLVTGLLSLSGAFGHSGTPTGRATHNPAPAVAKTHSASVPTPAGSPANQGPDHIPPGHAKGHGPKKKNKKQGHGHGHGPPQGK